MSQSLDGFQQTHNQMGITALRLDRLTASFVDYATCCQAPVLDIGAGIGTATIAALERGATVIASDICVDHLALLRQRVPSRYSDRLTLRLESFPTETQQPAASLDAILLARVIHFLTGPQIIAGLKQAYTWLRPGGKLFLSISTPYQNAFQPLIPHFEQRLKQGEPWPGYFPDLRQYGIHIDILPIQMHLFTPSLITQQLIQTGFQVDNSEYYLDPYFPESARLDGRETLLAIATKQ